MNGGRSGAEFVIRTESGQPMEKMKKQSSTRKKGIGVKSRMSRN